MRDAQPMTYHARVITVYIWMRFKHAFLPPFRHNQEDPVVMIASCDQLWHCFAYFRAADKWNTAVNYHVSAAATCQQQPPVNSGHLSTAATCQRYTSIRKSTSSECPRMTSCFWSSNPFTDTETEQYDTGHSSGH